jgi:hypothetical protein
MKKSFTLLEVLIAITILSFLVLATSHVIASLRISKKTVNTIYSENLKTETLVKTLYGDIMNSDGNVTVEYNNKHFARVYIHTRNTLYSNIYPYVMWYVSKKNNTLARIECYHTVDIKKQDYTGCIADVFKHGVSRFEIYKRKGRYLVYIDSVKPVVFEFFHGYEVNESKKTKKGK